MRSAALREWVFGLSKSLTGQQFQEMTELKVRLNDIVSPKQVGERKLGPLHCLNNSFLRSKFVNDIASKHASLPYQCKLPSISYARRDISHMLKYLLKKEQMNIPDRNLIRRILVGIFDEQLIHSVSKEFVNHIELFQGKEGTTFTTSAKMFYMMLKGSVTVRTTGLEYTKEQGETFGELEIMAGIDIESVFFQKNSLLITINEDHFREHFLPKFNLIYSERQAEVLSLAPLLNSVPIFFKYLILSRYEVRTFQMGEKITDRGEPMESLYVVGDRLREEKVTHLSRGCLGLRELQKGKETYLETIYCPENQMRIPVLKRQDFQRYILDAIDQSTFLENSSVFQKSMQKTTASVLDPEKKINNFMRIRNVRLISNKRVKTQSTFCIDNEFKFIKETRQCLNRTINKRVPSEESPKKPFSRSIPKEPRACFLK